jgi:hypothetical protein
MNITNKPKCECWIEKARWCDPECDCDCHKTQNSLSWQERFDKEVLMLLTLKEERWFKSFIAEELDRQRECMEKEWKEGFDRGTKACEEINHQVVRDDARKQERELILQIVQKYACGEHKKLVNYLSNPDA